MCKILLSINPEHVKNIFNGKKFFEYRKKSCKREVDKIVIYTTYPIKKVVGEVEVLEVIKMKKDELWANTKEYSGITKDFFDEYYKNNDIAIAYKLGRVIKYKNPKTLKEIGVNVAPQSYIYL